MLAPNKGARLRGLGSAIGSRLWRPRSRRDSSWIDQRQMSAGAAGAPSWGTEHRMQASTVAVKRPRRARRWSGFGEELLELRGEGLVDLRVQGRVQRPFAVDGVDDLVAGREEVLGELLL